MLPPFIVIGLILDVFHVLPRNFRILGIKLYLLKRYVCTFVQNIFTAFVFVMKLLEGESPQNKE